MDNYKQLYEKTNKEYKGFYPLTDILSIIDKESGKNLKQLLNQYNHIKLDWKGNTVDTRNSVPLILRHKGLFITYDNGTSIITEFYKGEDISVSINSIWQNDNNWTDLSPGASLADNEDIAEIDGKFKFADRNYSPAQFTGMGRVILRKNLVDVGGGQVKNVLTQDMINKSNTIYEIRYDFDLNGGEITIPEGCVLDFSGGGFSNGTIEGNQTKLIGDIKSLNDIDLTGSYNLPFGEVAVDWFLPNKNYGIDNSDYIQKAVDFAGSQKCSIVFGNSLNDCYLIRKPIYVSCQIKGLGRVVTDGSSAFICNNEVNIKDITISTYPYQGVDGATDKEIAAIHIGENNNSTYNSNISNVTIDGFYYGVLLNNTWNCKIQNLLIRRCRKGIKIIGKSVNNHIVNTNISCSGTNSVCIECGSWSGDFGEGLLISNSVLTGSEIGVTITNFHAVYFTNNIVDLCKYKCIGIYSYSFGCKFVNNYFASMGEANSGASDAIIEITDFKTQNTNDDIFIFFGNTIKAYSKTASKIGMTIYNCIFNAFSFSNNTFVGLVRKFNFNTVTFNRFNEYNSVSEDVDSDNILNNVSFPNGHNVLSSMKPFDNSAVNIGKNKLSYGISAPSEGVHISGDFVYNTNIKYGNDALIIGWVCATGGTPGIWVPLKLENYRTSTISDANNFTYNGGQIFCATGVANTPDDYGILRCYSDSGLYVQHFYPSRANAIYVRRCTSGVWSEWTKLG